MIRASSLKRGAFIVLALIAVVVASELVAMLANTSGAGLPVPISVLILALAPGCITALTAIGLVLIYRATRIINFAHAGFAAGASVLFYELVQYKRLPYLLALLAALGAGLLAGTIVELLFIRRFANAPRLVLTGITLSQHQRRKRHEHKAGK